MTVEGGPGRPASDVTVLAAPESPGDEIVRAVERVIGVTGPLPLWDERGPLPVENPLSSTGLHDGARLGVGRPGGACGTSRAMAPSSASSAARPPDWSSGSAPAGP